MPGTFMHVRPAAPYERRKRATEIVEATRCRHRAKALSRTIRAVVLRGEGEIAFRLSTRRPTNLVESR
jgi:hypothetical protein